MTKFKGTPGPWIAEGRLVLWNNRPAYREVIATTQGTERALANAQAISAVPELIEALSNIVSHFPHWASQIDMKQIDKDAIGFAKAAVAKALGEQS
jgi:hypothetical protein